MEEVPKCLRKTPVKRRPWGGRRKNAGRSKLPTPVRKQKYKKKVAQLYLSREAIRAQLVKLELEINNLRQEGKTNTEHYVQKEKEYQKLLRACQRNERVKGSRNVPRGEHDPGPSTSSQDKVADVHPVSSSDEEDIPPTRQPPKRKRIKRRQLLEESELPNDLPGIESSPEPEQRRNRRRGLLQQPIPESSEDNSAPEPDPQDEPNPEPDPPHQREPEPDVEEPAVQQTQTVGHGLPPTPPETDGQLHSDAPPALEELGHGQVSMGVADQFSTPIGAADGAEDLTGATPHGSGQFPFVQVTPWTPPIPSHLLGPTASEEIAQLPSRNLFPDHDDEGPGLPTTRYRPPLGQQPLGQLLYTAEEFIAIQIAIKIRGNIPDTIFKAQISAIANGLENADKTLPVTRHRAEQQLKSMKLGGKYFVIYCYDCLEICAKLLTLPKGDIKCPTCNVNLKKSVSEGRSYFIILSIRHQIEGYLKDKKFQAILKIFAKSEEIHMNGSLHKELIQSGHFDLSLGIDAAQLHKTYGKSILPAVLFLNNLPISWQLRYPILAALWTGESKLKPPRSIFLKHMLAELRELGKDYPIVWQDEKGGTHASMVFLTTVISDAPEKAELLNQVGPGGAYGCPYCKAPGETIRIEKYPRVFRDNPFRRTVGQRAVKGVRYPVFTYEDKNYKWRDSKGRMEMGRKVARRRIEENDGSIIEEGIKGLPVLRTLPAPFKETDSHVSDFLHLIAEGVFSDIMNVMTSGSRGLGHTFLQSKQSWDIFDDMQKSMTRVSECDRNCQLLRRYSEWKAYDCWEFLIHNVAQLCSDESIISNTQVYDCLVYLSNITYLWHKERISPALIKEVRKEIENFCNCFRSLFTEEFMTYKAHVLQHIPDFMERHGSGAYTDGFNVERFISVCKKLCTTNRVHMNQICRNFLLTHQSPILQEMENFSECAKKTLNENKLFTEEYFAKFSDVIKTKHPIQRIPEDISPVLQEFVTTTFGQDLETMDVTRVTQMARKSFILESEHATHRSNTAVDDSYLQVDESVFGRIKEIFHFPQMDKFVFVMETYYKIRPSKPGTGYSILYPINQFPFRAPVVPQYYAFLLTDKILLQKAKVGKTSYFFEGRKVQLFTVRPNFMFRF